MKPMFSMIIQWSEEDQVYVVSLPEFPRCQTHGSTYEEAARMGQEVLEMLIEQAEESQETLPQARTYDITGAPWDKEDHLATKVAEPATEYNK